MRSPDQAADAPRSRGLYCHDPGASAWLHGLVSQAIDLVLREFGEKHVQAVILLGSLARGEGSAYRDGEQYVLLGDMEFFVVLRRPFSMRDSRKACRELCRRAVWSDGTPVGAARLDLAPTTVDLLARTTDATIFAYDLQANKRCCWGDSGVLDAIPPPDRGSISKEDAVRLVSNRMVELAEADDKEDSTNAVYWQAKVLLDLAGSLLAFSGCYESSYAARAAALRSLVERTGSLEWIAGPSGFLERLQWATRCKVEPSPAVLTDCSSRPGIEQVQSWARSVWEWEVRNWLGGRPNDSICELVSLLKGRESLRERARGWLKFLLHPLRPRGALSVSRFLRLFPQASPQTLCYGSLVMYAAGMMDNREDWKRQALDISPVPVRDGQSESKSFDHLARVWNWLLK